MRRNAGGAGTRVAGGAQGHGRAPGEVVGFFSTQRRRDAEISGILGAGVVCERAGVGRWRGNRAIQAARGAVSHSVSGLPGNPEWPMA